MVFLSFGPVRRKNGFPMLSAYLDTSVAGWPFPVPGTSVGVDLTLGQIICAAGDLLIFCRLRRKMSR
jgi:hypothetical protein